MTIFVTGALGQLGRDLVPKLLSRGHKVLASDLAPEQSCLPEGVSYLPLDLTDAQAVSQALTAAAPQAVIHCAAWTAVDAAEDVENNAAVWKVNAHATKNLALVCRDLECKLVYISTDYVFSGLGETPWEADSMDFDPKNIYGRTKLGGEMAVRELTQKHFIVRTAWVFGKHGGNFVSTMLRLGRKLDSLRVVCDQIGTPTYTPDLARLLADMIETEHYGTYHATNEGGFISWYDFACEIFRQAGMDVRVSPVTTEEYGESKALRPKNSRLSKSKLTQMGFRPLPHWQDALKRYLEELEV